MRDSPVLDALKRGHEPDTPDGRRALRFVGAVVAGLGICVGLAFGALHFLGLGRPADVGSLPPRVEASPRLQTAPAADLAALRKEKAAMLEGYGWLDRGKGIVRIPIERAMALRAGSTAAPEQAPAVPPPAQSPAAAAFDQHLGIALPGGLPFRDETAHDVHLGDYFGAAPVVLLFTYYGCGSLCPTVVGDVAAKLAAGGLAAGKGYQVVVASIDPRDSPADAAARKAVYLGASARAQDAAGWHLLTGNEASVGKLTSAAGFRYAYDESTQQFAHPAGFAIVTPRGTVSRYFFGFDFTAAQLRSALESAADERIASPVARLLLLCFHFDPAGRYTASILATLRWVGIAGALLLVGWLVKAR